MRRLTEKNRNHKKEANKNSEVEKHNYRTETLNRKHQQRTWHEKKISKCENKLSEIIPLVEQNEKKKVRKGIEDL